MSNQPVNLGGWIVNIPEHLEDSNGNQGNQPSPQSHVPVQQLSNPSPYRPYQPPDSKPTGYRGMAILFIVCLLTLGYGSIGLLMALFDFFEGDLSSRFARLGDYVFFRYDNPFSFPGIMFPFDVQVWWVGMACAGIIWWIAQGGDT